MISINISEYDNAGNITMQELEYMYLSLYKQRGITLTILSTKLYLRNEKLHVHDVKEYTTFSNFYNISYEKMNIK